MGQTIQIAKAPITASRSAGKCGQIYGDYLPKLRLSKADSEKRVNDWLHTVFLWIKAQDGCRAARTSDYPKSHPICE
jgi:hypothetical protein